MIVNDCYQIADNISAMEKDKNPLTVELRGVCFELTKLKLTLEIRG